MTISQGTRTLGGYVTACIIVTVAVAAVTTVPIAMWIALGLFGAGLAGFAIWDWRDAATDRRRTDRHAAR